MLRFTEFVIETSPAALHEVTLKSLTTVGAATYLIGQSAVVKQNLSAAKQQRHIEDRLDRLGDAIQALSNKVTATAAISWGVAKKL